MYDYGSARHVKGLPKRTQHVRTKKIKSDVITHPDTTIAKQPSRSFGHTLRFILLVVLCFSIFSAIFISKILPKLINFQEPVNLIVVKNRSADTQAYFVHLNPDNELNYAVSLNLAEMVQLPFSTESLPLLQSLSQITTNDTTLEQEKAMYSHLFGIPITKLVVTDNPTIKHASEIHEIFSHSLDRNVTMPVETRLMLLLYYFYSQKQIKPMAELTSNMQISQQLSDNQAIWHHLAVRDCPIAVVNTTTIQGLAQAYSTLLEKSGGFVIRVTSSSVDTNTSTLFITNDTECQKIRDDIKAFFPAGLQETVDQAIANEYRAKIVLVLNENAGSF